MERTREHFQFLDTIRGVAILGVFLFHSLGASFGRDHFPWVHFFPDFAAVKPLLILLPATFGWAGVALFFVVSGFCIHLSFIRGAPGDWRGFYVRRFFRIYPPYLIALLIFAVIFPGARLSFHRASDWAQLGSHLLLLHNLDGKTFFGINPAFWSIAVEAQLYLIYPMLLALVSRIGWRRTLIALCALEAAIRGFNGLYLALTAADAPRWFSELPFCYWYSWTIGAAVADAYIQKRRMPFEYSPPALWLLLAICASYVMPLSTYSFLLFSVFTAAVIARVLKSGKRPEFQSPLFAHLRFLGVCSYSFYLLHQPFLGLIPGVLSKLKIMLPGLALFALCMGAYPFILALAWLYHTQCELRSIALGKLFIRRAHEAG